MHARCVSSTRLEDLLADRLEADERRSLLQHLGSCQLCNEVVAEVLATTGVRSVPSTGGDAAREQWSPEKVLGPGEAVGRYVIAGVLGSGGMGTVYRAHDPLLDRPVALKVLKATAVAQGATLIDEARTLAKLAHPNVVPVHEIGTDGSRAYLVMQLIEGESLAQWLATPRPWRAVAKRFLEAARGLDAAHQAGLVHGDFKPANVLIDQREHVMVVDFGLGHRLADASNPEPRARGGTPAYLAPELVTGAAPSPRSDQFSFFVALFEGVFGSRPFRGQSVGEVAKAIAAGQSPALPPGRTVPGWLRTLILKGLGAPESRHSSMREVMAELQRGLAPPARRLPMLVGGALAALGVAVTLWQSPVWRAQCGPDQSMAALWNPAVARAVAAAFAQSGASYSADLLKAIAPQLDDYLQRWQRLSEESCQALRDGTLSAEQAASQRACLASRKEAFRALTSYLEHAGASQVAEAWHGASALPGLEACREAWHLGAASPPPAVSAQVAAARGLAAQSGILRRTMQLDRARALASEAVSVALDAGHLPAVAEAHFELGSVLVETPQRREGVAMLKEAAWGAERANDLELVSRSAIALINAQALAADFQDAVTWKGHAQATLERLKWPALLSAAYQAAAARLSFSLSHYAEAVSHGRAAVALWTPSLGPAAPETLGARVELADALRRSAEYEAARDEALDVLTVARRAWGAEHPFVGSALRVVASCENRLGQYAEAAEHYRLSAAIWERALGRDAAQRAAALNNLGGTLLSLDRPAEALEAFDESVRIDRLQYDDNDPRSLLTRANRVDALIALGRHDEARAELILVLGAQRTLNVKEQAGTLLSQGELELATGHPSEALAVYETLLALVTAQHGPEHPEVAWALTGVAQALQALHRWRESVVHLRRAIAISADSPSHPERLAATKFLLAKGLFKLSAGNRAEARSFAGEAEKALRNAPGSARLLGEVKAWLVHVR